MHEGRIVAERYGPDYKPTTRLASWSIAKSVISTLIGLRVKQGILQLNQTRLFPEWSNAHDPRSNITLSDLLRMSSGLEFYERYDRPSDAREMLFMHPSVSDFAVKKPLAHPPGTKWSYSSGTSNLLSRLLRQTFPTVEEYWEFPRKALFDPLGMNSAIMETDAVGTLLLLSLDAAFVHRLFQALSSRHRTCRRPPGTGPSSVSSSSTRAGGPSWAPKRTNKWRS